MIEPVALKDFFITFFSSALIILAGAGYALFFAWFRIASNPWFKRFAYLSYLVLIVSVYQLTLAMRFSGYWLVIPAVMVIGYFFAPMGIWYLCTKTQGDYRIKTSTSIKED